MSFLNLDDLPYLALAGNTLNLEELTCVRSSLLVLQDAENFATVALWGKILGVQQDYLIAQALPSADLFKKKFFYSLDGASWLQLPEVGAQEIKLAEQVHGRFAGDPAFINTVGDAPNQTISEELRLSATVRQIDAEATVVPRGSYYRDAVGKIQVSPNFAGLAPADISYPESYLHFSPGHALPASADADASEVFTSISQDEPKGVWSIQLERNGALALVRSNIWPGYVFFHVPAGNGPQHPSFNAAAAAAAPLNTSNVGGLAVGGLVTATGTPSNGAKFGAWYHGTGQRGVNAAFML